MTVSEIENLLFSGELYDPAMPEIVAYQQPKIRLVSEFNAQPASEDGVLRRQALLRAMLRSVGEDCYIEPPLRANMGGAHVTIGDHFYANFNLTLVDDGEIRIGNNVQIGPNVTIATAAHPLSPSLRARGLQYNLPVVIEDDVWIGAGAILLPGVKIGRGSVIGAGSVVTKDIPPMCVAAGDPARLLRYLTIEDLTTYNHGVDVPERFRQ